MKKILLIILVTKTIWADLGVNDRGFVGSESNVTFNIMDVDSIKMLEEKVKSLKKENALNSDFFRTFVEKHPLTSKNVTAYNNIAYYLQKRGANECALTLLDMIIKRFPNRTVTHLNYADSTVTFNENSKEDDSDSLEEAKHHYLSYIAQMLKAKKASKIPKNLKHKYEKYYSFLNILNSEIKKDYQVLYLTEGDIDANGQIDISVVIEYADASKISNTKSIWERPSNINRRVWLLFLAEKNSYKLFRKNQQLIAADEYTNCDDNFDSIRIKNNNLRLNTHFWCGSGGWEMGNRSYQFIYRDNEIILAGSELSWSHRASAKGAIKSANFLTKKLKIQDTKEFGEADGKERWTKIKIDRPVLFEEYSLEMERKLIGG